jgi:hypothetical protein
MTEQELDQPERIPEGLWVSLLAYIDDPDWLPPQGSAGLRAMVKLGGDPNAADLDWIQNQYQLQDFADDLLKALTAVAPMPTQEDIMDSTEVAYPDWVGAIWVQTLTHPWSQDMAAAIEEGEAYVGTKTSA